MFHIVDKYGLPFIISVLVGRLSLLNYSELIQFTQGHSITGAPFNDNVIHVLLFFCLLVRFS